MFIMPTCDKCGFKTNHRWNLSQHKNSKMCKFKGEVIEKYKEGYSSDEIAEEIPLDGSSVCDILRRNDLLRTRSEARERAWRIGKFDSRRPELDLTPTSDFAWLVATLYCDGSVCAMEHISRYIVQLGVTDFSFSEKFEQVLEDIGFSTYVHLMQRGDYQEVRSVVASSKPFYEYWQKLERDDFRVLSKIYPQAFVRGCYDSEGSLTRIGDTGRFRISITNNSKWLLDICYNCIRENTDANVKEPAARGGNCYSLYIHEQESIKEFCEWVEPTIERKDIDKQD